MARLWLTWAAAGILMASSARADDGRRPLVEIGGNLSGVMSFGEDSVVTLVGGGPSVTINVARPIAVELRAETFGTVADAGTFALYVTQVKIPIRRSTSGLGKLSLTVGAAGAASYQYFPEKRSTRPDGSTVVHPEFKRLRLTSPNTFSAGVSGERVFSRHLSGTWAMQGLIGSIGGAVVASAGVSFGMGGYR